MGTLGQMMQAAEATKSKASLLPDEDFAAREAKRIKAKTDSLSKAIEKAKREITKAINAGKSGFDIGAKIHESDKRGSAMGEAYSYLRRLNDKRTFTDDATMHPLWDDFLAWAKAEDLRIELVNHLPDVVNGEQVSSCYVFIKARPINSLY